MKLPDPQPGSRTRPPAKPSLPAPSQITWASAGVGVVGVDRGAAGRGQLGGGQQAGQLRACPGELLAVLVEDLRDGAPAGPAGQDRLLGRGRRTGVVLQGAQDRERGEVGADPAGGARGCQVVLALRPERGQSWCCWLSSSAPGSGSSRIISDSTISSACRLAWPILPALRQVALAWLVVSRRTGPPARRSSLPPGSPNPRRSCPGPRSPRTGAGATGPSGAGLSPRSSSSLAPGGSSNHGSMSWTGPGCAVASCFWRVSARRGRRRAEGREARRVSESANRR